MGFGLLRMFYYWTQCWRWSPVHSYESCLVMFWSQNSSTSRLLKYLDSRPNRLTSSLVPGKLELGWNYSVVQLLLDFPNVIGPIGTNYGIMNWVISLGLWWSKEFIHRVTDASCARGQLLFSLLFLARLRHESVTSVMYNIKLHRRGAFFCSKREWGQKADPRLKQPV